MRKHVTPADPKATIPDPARGTDLPPEGREVAWGVHWARLEASGDIVARAVAAPAPAPETVEAAHPAEPEAEPAEHPSEPEEPAEPEHSDAHEPL